MCKRYSFAFSMCSYVIAKEAASEHSPGGRTRGIAVSAVLCVVGQALELTKSHLRRCVVVVVHGNSICLQPHYAT